MSISTITKVSLIGLAGLAFNLLSLPLSDPAHAAGFVTPYAPANFSLTNTGGASGGVNLFNIPAAFAIGSTVNNDSGDTSYLTTAAASGPVSFKWDFNMTNGSLSTQLFGYVLNGGFNPLTNNAGGSLQTGTASFIVAAGDSFGFRISNAFTPAFAQTFVDLSNFNGPTSVVPTPALLPGFIGMGVAAWRKRKAEAQAGQAEEA